MSDPRSIAGLSADESVEAQNAGDNLEEYSEADRLEDERLYGELDTESTKMRRYAEEFAKLLDEVPNKPKEIQLLIMSLNKIHTTDIQSMDVALRNFKKSIASIILKSEGGDLFGDNIPPELLPSLTDIYTSFIEETISLANKAIQLSSEG